MVDTGATQRMISSISSLVGSEVGASVGAVGAKEGDNVGVAVGRSSQLLHVSRHTQ